MKLIYIVLLFSAFIVTLLLYKYNCNCNNNDKDISNITKIKETYIDPTLPQSTAFQWCYNTGYPWSIPRISLPDCLGLLLQYQLEWWFYVGYLKDQDGTYYSVEFTVIRTGIGSPLFQVINGGIKVGSYNENDKNMNKNPFKTTDSYGLGASQIQGSSLYIPRVTDTVYQLEFKPNIGDGKDYFNVQTKKGVVGQPGTIYTILSKGQDYSFQFDIQDLFGGRMEGTNGFIGEIGGTNSSYEYCFPWNTVLPGGSIDFQGKKTTIKEGWIWLDRQVITYKDGEGPLKNLTQDSVKKNPKTVPKQYTLYTGNWIACVLPETNTSFYVACGWPEVDKKGEQWKVGSELGIPEKWKIGAVWGPPGSIPQGENIGDNFSLNIKDSSKPEKSPHWKSNVTGNTYCSAWKLTLNKTYNGIPNTLYFEYFRQDCETVPITGAAFMECAAKVYDSNMKQIGWGWVEQMGQN